MGGIRPLLVIVVGVGTVALVILGALIIDRGRSGSPDRDVTVGDVGTTVAGAGDSSGDGRPGTTDGGAIGGGVDPAEEEGRDLCQLLSPTIANSVLDLGWEAEKGPQTVGTSGLIVPACALDRHSGGEQSFRADLSLFLLEDQEADEFMTLEPKGDPGRFGDQRYRVDSELHEEAVPSLPEGRIVWCGCIAPTEDMRLEWVADGSTWRLSLELRYRNLGLYRERPGIEGQRDAMIGAAEEIHALILQGVGS